MQLAVYLGLGASLKEGFLQSARTDFNYSMPFCFVLTGMYAYVLFCTVAACLC